MRFALIKESAKTAEHGYSLLTLGAQQMYKFSPYIKLLQKSCMCVSHNVSRKSIIKKYGTAPCHKRCLTLLDFFGVKTTII